MLNLTKSIDAANSVYVCVKNHPTDNLRLCAVGNLDIILMGESVSAWMKRMCGDAGY